MIYVRITALPSDSALAIDANGGRRPWTVTEYLLADIWEVQANRGLKKGRKPKRHPARPVVRNKGRTPEQQQRHAANQRRHRRQYQQYYGAQ